MKLGNVTPAVGKIGFKLLMPSLLFTCPATNLKVQHWIVGDENTPDDEYEAVICKACARLHLVNRKTGKLLGQNKDQ